MIQSSEGAAHDEQHVGGVDLDEVLMRVLATALRRHRRRRALQDLEQGLLDALARHVAGDRRVLALSSDLVNLVDVDNAGLGLLHIEIGGLDELEQNVFDILADIAGFGQRGGVGNGKGDVQHLGQRLGEIGLSAAGRANQQNIRLAKLDAVIFSAPGWVGRLSLDTLVVVVDGNGERLLGVVLADHITIEKLADLMWLGQLLQQADLGRPRRTPLR